MVASLVQAGFSDAPDRLAPAIREVDALHRRAVALQASDIHIEPDADGGGARLRVDGILRQVERYPEDLFAQIVSRIKLLGGLDIADRRQPQDGRFTIECDGRTIDVRVNAVPTVFGEKLVLRLLDRGVDVPSFEVLGMPSELLDRFRRAVHAPHGFIVVCGPTGSGKTTTLYAALAERNCEFQSLCTVEDPVEIRFPGIAQVQVNLKAGVTFASALRAFLRQDPNVVMIGEMRDEETATAAVSAALSGQLVFTTLHSNDAPRTVQRLIELGISPHSISAALSAIVAQRLVRRLCEKCRIPANVTEEERVRWSVPDRPVRVFRAGGCAECDGSGFRGRVPVFEAVFIDDALRDAIASGASSVRIADLAARCGYEPMRADAVRLALQGRTSLSEIERVLPADPVL